MAVPTETVYGLAANATQAQACAKIFALKRRPANNPLIVHYAELKDLQKDVVWTDLAQALSVFWPGPLTLVLKRRKDSLLCPLVSAGLETVAVRMPAHSLFQDVIKLCGCSLAAPSANPSGLLSPTHPNHVKHFFSDLPIVDGGACRVGLESTVIDARFDSPILLRAGAVTAEAIFDKTGRHVQVPESKKQEEKEPSGGYKIFHSPGQFPRHYAPTKPLRMNATSVGSDEGLLGFGPNPLSGAKKTINLSLRGSLEEAAAGFFNALHRLDKSSVSAIAVMAIPEEGLGKALNDKVKRACIR